MILFLAMLITQAIIIQPHISSKAIYNTNEKQSFVIDNFQQKEVTVTPGPGGMVLIKSNVFADGDMEEEKTTGEPEAFYSYGSVNNYANHSY